MTASKEKERIPCVFNQGWCRGIYFQGTSPWGRKFKSSFELEVSKSLNEFWKWICAGHHLKEATYGLQCHIQWETWKPFISPLFMSLPDTPQSQPYSFGYLVQHPAQWKQHPAAGRPMEALGPCHEGLDHPPCAPAESRRVVLKGCSLAS